MAAAKKAVQASQPAIKSKLPPGKGSTRVGKKFIALYGGPKTGKTSSCATLRAKWIVADPNAIPRLEAMGKLPAPEDIYEVTSCSEARATLNSFIDVLKDDPKALGEIEAIVFDSGTQVADWLADDIAAATGQAFLGDNKKDGGHQRFNAEYSGFIDDLGVLSKYVHVVLIVHAQAKPAFEKGQWAGFSLPGTKVGEKLGRTANWVLYQTRRTYAPETSNPQDTDLVKHSKDVDGKWLAEEVIIHTRTVSSWFASINDASGQLQPAEVPDVATMLEKAGLL